MNLAEGTGATLAGGVGVYSVGGGLGEEAQGRLESGDLPLDQLLTSYQRGAALLQHCRDKLQAVEEQIKVLDDGVLKPWKPQ